MLREKRTVRDKIQVLRLAEKLGSVTEACRIAGFSRDSFYRFKRLYENGGARALESFARPRLSTANHIRPEIEAAVVELARTEPGYGRLMVSKVLHKRGLKISSSGVRLVWLRHGLETGPKRRRISARRGGILEKREELMCGKNVTPGVSDESLTG